VSTATPPATPAPAAGGGFQLVMFVALVAAAAGLGLTFFGYSLSFAPGTTGVTAEDFFKSYLVAWCFALGISMGSLALLMIQHVMPSKWGLVLRRPLEAACSPVVLLALAALFLPIILLGGLPVLYPWANPETVKNDEHGILQMRQIYMNVPLFLVRFGAFFAIWIGIAACFRMWSKKEDRTPDPQAVKTLGSWFRHLAAPGLLIYALTMTFAGIDWGMSINKHWYSTMYPVLFSFGALLSALVFLVAALVLLKPHTRLGALANHQILADLGSIMLAFTLMWAYLSFSQYLLVWSANLRGEVGYYTQRLNKFGPESAEVIKNAMQNDLAYYHLHTFGGYGYVGVLLVVGHFIAPFLLLLVKRVRHSPAWLLGIASWMLLMRFVDYFWTIGPTLTGGEIRPGLLWLDVAAGVGLLGLVVFLFLWQLQRQPIVPEHDPRLAEVGGHHG